MKRVVSRALHVLKSRKFKQAVIVVLIFGAGLLSGLLITNSLTKDSKPTTDSRPTSSISPEERARRSGERLEESFKRAKARVQQDLEAKRIDQKKADEINKKLEEIYNYRKENLDQASEAKRQELRDKRQEWRDWLEQNDISSRYFVGVL